MTGSSQQKDPRRSIKLKKTRLASNVMAVEGRMVKVKTRKIMKRTMRRVIV